MRIKQINNIRIDLDADGMYRCRRRTKAWGTVTLEEFGDLPRAEQFCRETLDYVKRKP
jgi:hypothetical protein